MTTAKKNRLLLCGAVVVTPAVLLTVPRRLVHRLTV